MVLRLRRSLRAVRLSEDELAPDSRVPDSPRFTPRGFFKLAGVATGLALVAQVARPAERALADTIGNPDTTETRNLYVPNGGIGIGTSSLTAGAALDVGGTGATVKAYVGPTDNHEGGLALRSGSAGAYWYLAKRATGGTPSQGFVLQYYDGTTFQTPALAATTTGQVGIGTAAPTYQLHVLDDSNAPVAILESGAHGAIVRGWSSGGTNAAPTQTPAGTPLVSLRGGGYTSGAAYTLDSISQINAVASEAFTATAQGTYLTFVTTPNGMTTPVERVRIDNAGNVGIGTANPSALLDANGLIAASGGASITALPPVVSANVGWKIGLWGSQFAIGLANWTVALATAGWVSVYHPGTPPANNATTLSPDTNAKVSLGANGNGLFAGNVGIGTPIPGARLHVWAGSILGQGLLDVAYTPPANASTANFLTYSYAANNWSGIGGYQNGGMWLRAQDFTFWTPGANATPVYAFQLGQDGSFKIGTTKVADSTGCYYA